MRPREAEQRRGLMSPSPRGGWAWPPSMGPLLAGTLIEEEIRASGEPGQSGAPCDIGRRRTREKPGMIGCFAIVFLAAAAAAAVASVPNEGRELVLTAEVESRAKSADPS